MKNSFIDTLEKILKSNLLIKELVTIPDSADVGSIMEEQKIIGKKFSNEHIELLKHYNGIDLDVIRFYGVGVTIKPIKRLARNQDDLDSEYIAIGDDPAGFTYIQDKAGKIYSIDSEAGEIKYLTSSLSELITCYIFGKDASQFGGKDWEDELKDNKIL